MRVPDDALIPIEKLTKDLLVPRDQDDKSKFLALAGFDLAAPETLLDELRRLAIGAEAIEDRTNDYGTISLVRGGLNGPNGRTLNVITVWIHLRADGTFRFVTLKPDTSRQP